MLVKGNKKTLPKPDGGILLIQLGDIGDVVLTMPAIKSLRENFPGNDLFVCVREKSRELIEDCPWANGVISVRKTKKSLTDQIGSQKDFFCSLRKHRFELAIDLRTGTRGAILAFLTGAGHRIGRFAEDGRLWRNRLFTHLVRPDNETNQYCADHNFNILMPLELKVDSRLPRLIVPPEKKEKAIALLKQEKVSLDTPVIALHPFSLWKYKELGIDQCVSLIDCIMEKYHFPVIITGAPNERVRVEELIRRCVSKPFNLAGKTSIGELPGVLGACGLFIGVDTAALHIAAAVGLPTVGIFGPSSPISWAPRGKRHRVIAKHLPCVPCREKGCKNTGKSRCLEELTTEEIMEKVDGQMVRMLTEPG